MKSTPYVHVERQCNKIDKIEITIALGSRNNMTRYYGFIVIGERLRKYIVDQTCLNLDLNLYGRVEEAIEI